MDAFHTGLSLIMELYALLMVGKFRLFRLDFDQIEKKTTRKTIFKVCQTDFEFFIFREFGNSCFENLKKKR